MFKVRAKIRRRREDRPGRVEAERGCCDQTELRAERDLGEIHDEEKPCRGADEGDFVHLPREEIERRNRARGIGQHGGHTRGPAGREAEQGVTRHSRHGARTQPLQDGQRHQAEDHPTQQGW